MKAIKISLVVIVLVAIVTGVYFWTQKPMDAEGEIASSENTFISKIEQEIEDLKTKPETEFCKQSYLDIRNQINEFYKPHPPQYPYGRLGDTQIENDQNLNNFYSNLYVVYSDIFIKQVKRVFKGSEWKAEDLKFILSEKNELKNSHLLIEGSYVDSQLNIIQSIITKYNEIADFISSIRGFSYSHYGLSIRFPIDEVQTKINRAANLENELVGNTYVGNCTRLQVGLKGIPRLLFNSHINYLENKIANWSNMYDDGVFNTHSDYANNLYWPLKKEIEILDEDIYHVSNFYEEYNRLSQLWIADNIAAYQYLKNKANEKD